jgi:hypothetical protein
MKAASHPGISSTSENISFVANLQKKKKEIK